jgi:hypothetical protein
MEECLICLEEQESHQFVVLQCKHQICRTCFPIAMLYSTVCPVCEHPITVLQQETTYTHYRDVYKIIGSCILVGCSLYLLYFVQKN